jgi:guanylate kinase
LEFYKVKVGEHGNHNYFFLDKENFQEAVEAAQAEG